MASTACRDESFNVLLGGRGLAPLLLRVGWVIADLVHTKHQCTWVPIRNAFGFEAGAPYRRFDGSGVRHIRFIRLRHHHPMFDAGIRKNLASNRTS